jgi:mannosyltransferase
MTNKRVLTLDCNIFGLQQYGGVSNYLSVLLGYISHDQELIPELVLPQSISYKAFDTELLKICRAVYEFIHPKISQYFCASSQVVGDIFHTPYYRLPGRGVSNYIVTVYDFTYERFRKGLPRLVHSYIKSRSIRRADNVICISEATKRDLLEFFPWVDHHKIHIIYLGVDHKIYYPDKEKTSGTGLSRTVLFVGQRKGYKRFDLAIDAIRLCPNLTLGIVGPKLRPDEKKYLNEKLDNRWYEIGLVDSDRLRKLYSSAFALIFPSEYEGFGMPILEAMACGCPVIASQIPVFKEVGGDCIQYSLAQNGASYCDSLVSLEYDNPHRDKVIKSGLIRSTKYQWEEMYHKTRALYLA